MTMTRTIFLIALTALASGSAFAGDKVVPEKAKPCFACHGEDGNAAIDPQYPRLAGQYHDYLEQALREYKNGKRKNPIMGGFATTLSEQDILDVAAYFSALPGKVQDLHGHLQGQ